MSEILKPCPFCGSNKVTETMTQAVSTCGCINADPFSYDYPTVEIWNNRPMEDKLRAEIERMRKALEFYASDDNWYIGTDFVEWVGGDSREIAREALKGE